MFINIVFSLIQDGRNCPNSAAIQKPRGDFEAGEGISLFSSGGKTHFYHYSPKTSDYIVILQFRY